MNGLVDWEEYERKQQRVLWVLAVLALITLGAVLLRGGRG